MDGENLRGPFVTGQCVRCGMEALGGICDECLADLAAWLESAARTWRRLPPRARLSAARAAADDLHSAVWTPPPDGTPGLDADGVELSDL